MSTRTWALVTAAALWHCGGGSAAEGAGTEVHGTTPAGGSSEPARGTAQYNTNMAEPADVTHASTDAAAGSTMPATAPVSITPGTPTPIPQGLNPRVAITAPANNSTVRTNRVEVHFNVRDWPAPQDGRHVHLIVDNEPYIRIDHPERPHALENLAEGTHVLRAFPGWATHESVKRDGAFAVTVFHVGHATPAMHFDPRAPLLTYSRPKGEYNGQDAEHILLDFYLSNVPGNALGANGHRVRYAIDGATNGVLTEWAPHFIDHLPDGAHTILLELLGPDGQPVAGPFNRTERTIHVNRTAPTANEHSHGGTPAGTAVDAGAAPPAH